jgi:dTDP-4-amino-4,6-dideoxygalactose transaminase
MTDTVARSLSREIEAYFGGRCFLLARGRVGLYVGLRAMRLPPGAKVLMPGYTCMVVPYAVQYAGLKPCYVDIDPRTYNLDPALLDQAAGGGAAALVVQHTYGIPCDMPAIQEWRLARSVPMIEDCCHTLGSRVRGRLCGTFGQFAFMSGQWNKPFSTGLGGMLVVNDPALAGRVEEIIRAEAVVPGRLTNLLLALQLLAYRCFVRPATADRLTRLYRSLNRRGLVIGSSSEGELQGEMPRGYLATMAGCQMRQGVREMARVEENIGHRRRLTAFYHGALAERGFSPLALPGAEELPLLRYPVRVANKAEVLERAARARMEIGSWFEVPLHPATTRMEDLGYRPGMCPHAERASREVVNLPTHLKVDDFTAERSLEFLRKYAHPA